MVSFSYGLQRRHLFYIFPKIKLNISEDTLQLSGMHFKDLFDDHTLLLFYYLLNFIIKFL
jgi:hypothetical protein